MWEALILWQSRAIHRRPPHTYRVGLKTIAVNEECEFICLDRRKQGECYIIPWVPRRSCCCLYFLPFPSRRRRRTYYNLSLYLCVCMYMCGGEAPYSCMSDAQPHLQSTVLHANVQAGVTNKWSNGFTSSSLNYVGRHTPTGQGIHAHLGVIVTSLNTKGEV